jgi:hypothetical protein
LGTNFAVYNFQKLESAFIGTLVVLCRAPKVHAVTEILVEEVFVGMRQAKSVPHLLRSNEE